ncbi:hypothetical protein C8Q73DRAFT_430167 [Cubamyces lactineus]|nr:hypothetical protein C8Q73DRAFT_430167 [Cubamyces lactineus]
MSTRLWPVSSRHFICLLRGLRAPVTASALLPGPSARCTRCLSLHSPPLRSSSHSRRDSRLEPQPYLMPISPFVGSCARASCPSRTQLGVYPSYSTLPVPSAVAVRGLLGRRALPLYLAGGVLVPSAPAVATRFLSSDASCRPDPVDQSDLGSSNANAKYAVSCARVADVEGAIITSIIPPLLLNLAAACRSYNKSAQYQISPHGSRLQEYNGKAGGALPPALILASRYFPCPTADRRPTYGYNVTIFVAPPELDRCSQFRGSRPHTYVYTLLAASAAGDLADVQLLRRVRVCRRRYRCDTSIP